MSIRKQFYFPGTSATTATGKSYPLSLSKPNKTVVAYLTAAGGAATVDVLGSNDGGTNTVVLDTLTLSGASATDAYKDTNGYTTLVLNVTGITSATVAARASAQ